MNIYEGNLLAEGKKIGIVISRFHELFTKNLLDGAIDCIKRHGGKEDNIDIAWVPGTMEIPFAAKKMASLKKYDGLICLSIIIRGATTHSEYIAGQISRFLGQINVEMSIPVTGGIIIAENIEQAEERAGTKMGNKGWQAALSLIEMINLNNILK
ncbi:MAG: 6,7-dimethyl-8-ribityllumazine synthase [Candidatus Omnitrophica bacterium]|jgi:6,7-dimethyl-8-ribityllumazine synthase|nr:6,7-dimethyl-8-ribityllumazine synthase [Candidatus Omnitrophota bacterium]